MNCKPDCKGTALSIFKCKVFTIAMHSKNKCLNGSDGASLLQNKKIYCFFDQRSDLEQQCKHTQSGHRREVFHKSSRSESCH